MAADQKKGFKLIKITLREFLEIFRAPNHLENPNSLPFTYLITRFDLPADARAVAAQYDISYDAFIIKVESVEFPEVIRGMTAEFIYPRQILLSGKTIIREGEGE